jgi:hypothetical protein
MQANELTLAIVAGDTAEKEPSQIRQLDGRVRCNIEKKRAPIERRERDPFDPGSEVRLLLQFFRHVVARLVVEAKKAARAKLADDDSGSSDSDDDGT